MKGGRKMLNVYYVYAHIVCAYRGRKVTEQYLEKTHDFFSSKIQTKLDSEAP